MFEKSSVLTSYANENEKELVCSTSLTALVFLWPSSSGTLKASRCKIKFGPFLRTVCRPGVRESQVRSQLLHFCRGVVCSLKRECGFQSVSFHSHFTFSDTLSERVDAH